MSVHGEFGRTLEQVIDALGATSHARGRDWRAALEAARLDRQPDLSSAARAALAVSEALADDAEAEPRIAQVADHLDRHCRVILGLPPR